MTNERQRTRNRSSGRGPFSQFLVVVVLLGVTCVLFWKLWVPSSLQSPDELETSPTSFYVTLSEAEPSELRLNLNSSNPECRKLQSQHGEDKQLFVQYWAFPEIKRDGVFLELGALDGVFLSNSYWYEKCLGWTGVLIEGHPTAARALRRNRPKATNFEAAACEEDEGTVTFVGIPNGLSGDIKQMTDEFIQTNHKNFSKGTEEVHIVKCRRISSMLEEAKVDHIDFWTLDVEGAEFKVLTTFDWEKVPVHVLVIENDKDENIERKRRHDLLTSKGMTYIGPLHNNELWVNLKYPDIVIPSTKSHS